MSRYHLAPPEGVIKPDMQAKIYPPEMKGWCHKVRVQGDFVVFFTQLDREEPWPYAAWRRE